MYAIVEIAGQQFKVEKDQRYFVHQLEGKAGSNVTFDQVLLLDDNGKVSVGAPAVNGVQVTAKIVQHLKGDKVIVFKKKRRKGYAVKNGHRQRLTEISIQEIGKKAVTKKSVAPKKETIDKKAATKKAVAPKKETVEKKAAPKKTATAKKASPAKSVAKKAAPKKDS